MTADPAIRRLQRVDDVLRRESEGVLEIVVIRGREVGLWRQAVAGGDESAARRLAVARAQVPDFLADVDERRCVGCDGSFSHDSLPVDVVIAHAPVSKLLPSAAALGGVCSRCSAKHAAAELRELFMARMRAWYPDLTPIEPASLSAAAGHA
jgi:hypothetical protein